MKLERGGCKDSDLNAAESRLRSLLLHHKSFLECQAATIAESRNSFLSQLGSRAASLKMDKSMRAPVARTEKRKIKLVSIDVNNSGVHSLLNSASCQSPLLAEFLENTMRLTSTFEDIDDEYDRDRVIFNTHVTLVHRSQMKQADIEKRFGGFIGANVELTASAVLFSKKVAALSISAMKLSDPGKDNLPGSHNVHPHITLWCSSGTRSHEANDLPTQVDEGNAHKVQVFGPNVLIGSIKYWL